jgi:hypothetical protein
MKSEFANAKSAPFTMAVLLSIAFLISGFTGCASTAPTTGAGTPDSVQLQHYEMLKSAIEAKSKNDALAALALLDADVARWRETWTIIASAMYEQAALTDAVNAEDWPLATKLFNNLKAKYGRH